MMGAGEWIPLAWLYAFSYGSQMQRVIVCRPPTPPRKHTMDAHTHTTAAEQKQGVPCACALQHCSYTFCRSGRENESDGVIGSRPFATRGPQFAKRIPQGDPSTEGRTLEWEAVGGSEVRADVESRRGRLARRPGRDYDMNRKKGKNLNRDLESRISTQFPGGEKGDGQTWPRASGGAARGKGAASYAGRKSPWL